MAIGLKIIEKLFEENPLNVLEKIDLVLEETANKLEETLKTDVQNN